MCRIELGLDGARGGGISEDAQLGEFFQSLDADSVVTVFVREKDGVNAGERFADGSEELLEFARRKTGVDEDARSLGD
jgi:hypothetical protein